MLIEQRDIAMYDEALAVLSSVMLTSNISTATRIAWVCVVNELRDAGYIMKSCNGSELIIYTQPHRLAFLFEIDNAIDVLINSNRQRSRNKIFHTFEITEDFDPKSVIEFLHSKQLFNTRTK